jgi:hypothetical protein
MSRSRSIIIALICILLVVGAVVIWAAVNDNGKEKMAKMSDADDDKGDEADDEDDDAEEEEEVALSDVPQKVLDAAKEAVPGSEVEEVEKEVEDGVVMYDVEVVADGDEYEVEVTADGVVKEIEKDDEEKDDDDDDDEEDD